MFFSGSYDGRVNVWDTNKAEVSKQLIYSDWFVETDFYLLIGWNFLCQIATFFDMREHIHSISPAPAIASACLVAGKLLQLLLLTQFDRFLEMCVIVIFVHLATMYLVIVK
jgi:hypothetical protein